MTTKKKKPFQGIRANIIAGILTIVPLWITWVVFKLVFELLSTIGTPWVKALAKTLTTRAPVLSGWVDSPMFQQALAVILTLVALYILGWLTTHVVGKRALVLIDGIIQKIPFVELIYGATKKLIAALQSDPENKLKRVVLINFPSDSMKTLGFVTAVMNDKHSGEELAAVYVPTTPNPTSGYLEIVPVSKIVSTNMSIDEAMTFIISGGAVAPDSLSYRMAEGES